MIVLLPIALIGGGCIWGGALLLRNANVPARPNLGEQPPPSVGRARLTGRFRGNRFVVAGQELVLDDASPRAGEHETVIVEGELSVRDGADLTYRSDPREWRLRVERIIRFNSPSPLLMKTIGALMLVLGVALLLSLAGAFVVLSVLPTIGHGTIPRG